LGDDAETGKDLSFLLTTYKADDARDALPGQISLADNHEHRRKILVVSTISYDLIERLIYKAAATASRKQHSVPQHLEGASTLCSSAAHYENEAPCRD
jgi:hypothetical protein